ncbi:MAG: hypothetical protein SFW09_13455 [Hyphomicrobiaceae bacterium]|nr:hypothetical protein [Hyphomicrobiaceae bacterium]
MRLRADRLGTTWTERDEWPLGATILAFVAGFALMTWPWLTGRVSIPWDAKAHFLPQVQFLAHSIWRGEAPWWNPFVFSGQPQVADPQSMLFSPPFVLLALVNPSPGAWEGDLTVLSAMCLGGVGLILWFRDREWHWAGALVAALAFTFGAAMAWRIQHWGQVLSLAYLPWVLLMLDRALERGSALAGLGAGVIAAFLVLGRDQVALLCVYLLVARAIWQWAAAAHPASAVRRSFLPLLLGAVAGVAIIALPVLMTVLLAAESNRPSIDFAGAGAGSLHPALLVTLLIPQVFGAAGDMADFWGPPSMAWVGTGLFTAQNVGQLYIGIVPLLLVVGGTLTGRLWRRDIRFFAAAFVVVLLYGLGWYTPAFRLLYELPGVSLYRRPADAVFVIGALGAILAGYSVHAWFQEPWLRPSFAVIIGVCGVVAAGFAAALVFGLQIDRLHRLPSPLGQAALWLIASGGVMAWTAPRVALAPRSAALALGLITALDLGVNNGPSSSSALPPSTYEALEPSGRNETIRQLKERIVADERRRDRIELAGLGFHWPNASMSHSLENTLGYNPVRLGLYSRATGAEDHVGLPDQRKFSPLFPSYRSLLADMLGLRWIAAGAPIEQIDKRLSPGVLPLVAQSGSTWIYENPTALPRVLFVTKARAAVFEDILATGRWPAGFDPQTTVLLTLPAVGGDQRRPGSVRLIDYRQTRIEIDAESPDGGWIVLNDVWHPWWRAEVDRSPVPVEQANVLFRAVAVPPGRHRVVMSFRPLVGVMEALAERARGSPASHP